MTFGSDEGDVEGEDALAIALGGGAVGETLAVGTWVETGNWVELADGLGVGGWLNVGD